MEHEPSNVGLLPELWGKIFALFSFVEQRTVLARVCSEFNEYSWTAVDQRIFPELPRGCYDKVLETLDTQGILDDLYPRCQLRHVTFLPQRANDDHYDIMLYWWLRSKSARTLETLRIVEKCGKPLVSPLFVATHIWPALTSLEIWACDAATLDILTWGMPSLSSLTIVYDCACLSHPKHAPKLQMGIYDAVGCMIRFVAKFRTHLTHLTLDWHFAPSW